jgi:hypothetical protein
MTCFEFKSMMDAGRYEALVATGWAISLRADREIGEVAKYCAQAVFNHWYYGDTRRYREASAAQDAAEAFHSRALDKALRPFLTESATEIERQK